MRRNTISQLRDDGFRVYVERGRVTATRQDDGLTLHYFPELGSWYWMEDGHLIQAPARVDGTFFIDEDGLVNSGEVTAFNEASAIDTAIIRDYFGPLPRTAYTGR